jgi:hypothetical protein
MLNPLRSEAEAFRFFLWAAATIIAITLLILLLRAVF